MDDEQQRALLQASKLVHARWYESGYPDVAQTGMHPIDHYLRIGAALGRNPSSRFDTRFYLNANPSARASCLNPLVHYLVHGRRQDLPCLPEGAGGAVDGGRMNAPPDRARLLVAKRAFWELGLTDAPLATLRQIATCARAMEGTHDRGRKLAGTLHQTRNNPRKGRNLYGGNYDGSGGGT